METKTVERNWGAEPERAPDLADGDKLLYSEHGRVLDRVDYRSHYFRLVVSEYGSVSLLVKHGGGQERFNEHSLRKVVSGLSTLSSDDRYLMLHALYQMYTNGRSCGHETTSNMYRSAFIEGRMKMRRCPRAGTKFWIEPKTTPNSI